MSTTDLLMRLAAVEQELQELRSLPEEVKQLRSENQTFRAHIDILQHSNEEFAQILRRSLVDDTLKYLEATAGQRLVNDAGEVVESWFNYIKRTFDKLGAPWFKQRKLPVACLGLLPMGPGSPFQQGCDAAHELRTLNPDVFRSTYLLGLPVGERGQWEKLFEFLPQASAVSSLESDRVPSDPGLCASVV